MEVEHAGSVRVDLLGGTLDIPPIHLTLPNVVTINLATSLRARVKIKSRSDNMIEVRSLDYDRVDLFSLEDLTSEKVLGDHFGKLNFVMQILFHFNPTKGLELELSSGSPPGAGLGGSSSMGVTLFSALCKYYKIPLHKERAINIVRDIEARVLDCGPTGYQDYYPAMHGGVLALKAEVGGVCVEQFYSADLKQILENSLTLVYSGETRLSGINNWEVFKGFVDKKSGVREGLTKISNLSYKAYQALAKKDYSSLISLIAAEGAEREKLFANIVTPSMNEMRKKISSKVPEIGMKICGAGGGGCFLLTHPAKYKDLVRSLVNENGMKVLDFIVEKEL
jgi:D-glycero-alpha-D-manno-heptose-7-phosphate kinase